MTKIWLVDLRQRWTSVNTVDLVDGFMIFTVHLKTQNRSVESSAKAGKSVSYRPKREGDVDAIINIAKETRIIPAEQMRMAMEALIDCWRRDPESFKAPVEMRCVKPSAARKAEIQKRGQELASSRKPRS